MQHLSKLPLLLILLTGLFACNFERNGDKSEVDEDMFSAAEYGNDVSEDADAQVPATDQDDEVSLSGSTSGDPLTSGSGTEMDGDVNGDGTVTWTEQSARSSVTANSADYDSSGIKRYDTAELDKDKIQYMQNPASFTTDKNIPNLTGITTSDRSIKRTPLGKDADYDGIYKDEEIEDRKDHKKE